MALRKLGVIGAGTMGAGIAALAASAGVPVVLLDIPGDDANKNGPAERGLQRALKARPAAIMDPDRTRLVTTGNLEDDLGRLRDADWIIEAIVEQPGPKQELYARLEPVLKDTAIVSSNTSGIPMKVLLKGRTDAFKRRFVGAHFFNPPRYLHLLELIPTPDTDEAVLETVRRFGEQALGKGVVVAKDAPGFIANRLGVYGMLQALRLMEKHGLTIDEVDALTGPALGRPNSATFRTADLTGLDVLQMVSAAMGQATGEDFGLPGWTQALVAQGHLGEKTGSGFYKKEGRDILTLNYETGDYRPQEKPSFPELKPLRDKGAGARIAGALALPGKYGAFVRDLLAHTFHYALTHLDEVAYDASSVDRALRWGFGWEQGPLETMRELGEDRLRELFAGAGLDTPDLSALGEVAEPEGLEAKRRAGNVLETNPDASLHDLGDGVALLEFHSKLNTIGQRTQAILHKALERVEREGWAGLVIGNEASRAFSAGANLSEALGAVQAGGWQALEKAVEAFQDATMSLRRAPVPVVAAPFGMTLGGGAEMALHADVCVAHAEVYMGLVETGVGLIPGGGGTKELLFRFTKDLVPYPEADPFEAVKRAFTLIAMAQTSGSALEARKMGFLRGGDRIVMNRDLLLDTAKRQVLALAPGYVPPLPMTIRALGSAALGNLRYAVWQFQEAGQISEHDARIGLELARVLSSGEGAPREVTEDEVLGLERQTFLTLLGLPKTQERIMHTLKTGKPLRN